MTRVRIDHATYLVTVDPTNQVHRNATITIDDGIITAITTEVDAKSRSAREATEGPEPQA